MSAPDTSAEAVERVASAIADGTRFMRDAIPAACARDIAALLRALVAERDRMDKALMREAEGERAAYARGFREGAETMRERAKAPVLRRANVIRAYSYSKHDRWPAESLEALAEEISALSLPEPQA